MKVKVEVELEIPDDYANAHEYEIMDLVWSNFYHYSHCSHLNDVTKWMARIEQTDTTKAIIARHKNWAKILEKGEKSLKVSKI